MRVAVMLDVYVDDFDALYRFIASEELESPGFHDMVEYAIRKLVSDNSDAGIRIGFSTAMPNWGE